MEQAQARRQMRAIDQVRLAGQMRCLEKAAELV
jgi:hypothetical protein